MINDPLYVKITKSLMSLQILKDKFPKWLLWGELFAEVKEKIKTQIHWWLIRFGSVFPDSSSLPSWGLLHPNGNFYFKLHKDWSHSLVSLSIYSFSQTGVFKIYIYFSSINNFFSNDSAQILVKHWYTILQRIYFTSSMKLSLSEQKYFQCV